MLQVTIYQNSGDNADSVTLNTTSEFEFNLDSSKSNVSKAVGTICGEVFYTMDVYRGVGTRFVACNAPVNIRMKLGRTVIDTGTLKRDLQAGLKLGYNWKSRKRFAQNMFSLVNFMLHTATTQSHNEIDALCDDKLNKQVNRLLQA